MLLMKWKDYNDSFAEITYIYKCQEFAQDEIFAVPKKAKFWELVFAVSRNECILRELIFAVHKKSAYFNLTVINDTKIIFFVEHYSFALKSHICLIVHTLRRPYSRPLLGATIEPNLVPWILKNTFSL